MTKVFLVCAALACLPHAARSQAAQEHPSWPPPPDRTRIRHVATVLSPAGLEEEKGFFAKLIGTIFGSSSSAAWLVQPVGVGVTRKGDIIVADPGAKGIHVINPDGKKYDFIPSTKFGAFDTPVGVAVGTDGKVYVSDSKLHEIVVFDGDMDAEDVRRDSLDRPTGMYVAGDTLYVADAGLQRIAVFTTGGRFIGARGTHGAGIGQFNYPVSVAGAGDSLYIVDALNYRIETLSHTGGGTAFGSQGNATGRFAAPKSIALDSDRNIYVTDALLDNVQIFDRSGRLLLAFGVKGTRDGEFFSPSGIAIDASDRIYVVDALNKRIQIFQYLK